MKVRITTVLSLLGLLAACSPQPVGSVTQDVWGNGGCGHPPDAGGCLDATLPQVVASCGDGGLAAVTLSGKVAAQSAASTTILYSVDGGPEVQAGIIAPGAFLQDHGELIAPYSFGLDLSPGHYELKICFEQGVGEGQVNRVCIEATIHVECEQGGGHDGGDVCGKPALGFFGDLVANKVLCNSGHNDVPVHLKAHAGDDVWLTIDGPGGYQKVVPMRRAGDSCVYQYNWATRGGDNGGPGDYTFTATDRGAMADLATFKATLGCTR